MKKIASNIFEMGLGVVGLFNLNFPNIDGETCTSKWVFFKSVFWCLLVTRLVDSPSDRCMLGYYGVLIRALPFLQ